MKRSIGKIQGYYRRQLISAEESTTERLACGELSRKQAKLIMANLYSYVGEQEKYFACY